jgi:hypothetical protein
MALMAAFGLPTMKRGAINAIDWFSVMVLTLLAALVWLFWIAKLTGWPAQLAKNALKLVPGFKPEFGIVAFIVAATATIGWIVLVHWRLSRQPAVLWRAVVLSSGGLILLWVLLMTLFLPDLNYSPQLRQRGPADRRAPAGRGRLHRHQRRSAPARLVRLFRPPAVRRRRRRQAAATCCCRTASRPPPCPSRCRTAPWCVAARHSRSGRATGPCCGRAAVRPTATSASACTTLSGQRLTTKNHPLPGGFFMRANLMRPSNPDGSAWRRRPVA